MKEAKDKKKNRKQEKKAIIHLILGSPKVMFAGINRFMFFKSIIPRRGLKELSVSRNSYFIEMLSFSNKTNAFQAVEKNKRPINKTTIKIFLIL